MSILKILEYPNNFLRKKSIEIVNFDASLANHLENMKETMYANNGVGLASIQTGHPIRALIINIPREDGNIYQEDLLEIINPKITKTSGTTKFNEGCLSVPDFYEDVDRFENIDLTYQNRDGALCHLEANGYLAVAIQHELDHLNGILFIDKLSITKRKKFEKEFKKLKNQN